MADVQASASGVIALLDEPDASLQAYALQQLNASVHLFWPEISDVIQKIEVLYEDANFEQRQLAALVASKVFYYLGDLDEALNFAISAGKLFDVDAGKSDQYVETMSSECIDRYVQLRASGGKEDERMRQIVERLLDRCLSDKEYKQALGIALECRRLDIVDRIFDLAANEPSLLTYVFESVILIDTKIDLRNTVLQNLVRRFQSAKPEPDNFSIAQCFIYLNSAPDAAALLEGLLAESKQTNDRPALQAYQIAFDLADSATQEFLTLVRQQLTPTENVEQSAREQVVRILTGTESIKLYLEFLHANNHADLLILKKSKELLEGRNSVFHSAVTFANAFTNAGTTSDKFLRGNLDWLGKASNWSKFSATAALGVIHKGNLEQGRSVLEPYLPPPAGQPSVSSFSEGGSLYALGLIHANHGVGVLDYLTQQLKDATNETIQHGAALGLGVAGMATGNEDIYDALRTTLYTDSATAGEAAGYAMGLVMLGTASTKALDEMLTYAHETQHEKIIRGLAVGIAFLMYGKQEEADQLIDTLMAEKDPILRYGGIFTIALAYAGTSNNNATRRLLHVAVSDVDDSVRRAAVIALGFILFRNPTLVPRMVQLLSESYNPNVRYGAALALGIACAGTGSEDAVEILEPLAKDPIDFVRQAACIALAMVLIQQNEAVNPKVGPVRKIFEDMIADKHEDAMAKLGATLAQGFIDAGGRNVTITMQSKSGSSNMPAVVGLVLFSQFWYWFPLAHAACLAFTPTAIIGVNHELKIPKFDFVSQTRASLYAYPPETKPPKKEKIEQVETAVLSTTAKTSARAKTKEKERADADMDTDEKATTSAQPMDTDEPKQEAKATGKAEKRKPEPSSEQKPNMSRVVAAQLPHVVFPPNSRYLPVRSIAVQSAARQGKKKDASAVFSSSGLGSSTGGILLMRDTRPDEPAEYLELTHLKVEELVSPAAASSTPGAFDVDMTSPIADPPPAFEYDF